MAALSECKECNDRLINWFPFVPVTLMSRKRIPLMEHLHLQAHQAIVKKLVDLIGITSTLKVLVRLYGADEHLYSSYTESMKWTEETDFLEVIVEKFSSSLNLLPSSLEPRPTTGIAHAYNRQITHGSVTMEVVEGMLESSGGMVKLLDVSSSETVLVTTYGKLQPPLGKHRPRVVQMYFLILIIFSFLFRMGSSSPTPPPPSLPACSPPQTSTLDAGLLAKPAVLFLGIVGTGTFANLFIPKLKKYLQNAPDFVFAFLYTFCLGIVCVYTSYYINIVQIIITWAERKYPEKKWLNCQEFLWGLLGIFIIYSIYAVFYYREKLMLVGNRIFCACRKRQSHSSMVRRVT